MNKLVEHVACCLGESVTGNPTQFVLERLASSKTDLRYFTAEVPAAKLSAAVEGIRAMNFDAIIFLQDVGLNAGITFETHSQSVIRSGFLNVARRIQSSWIADNLDGAVIMSVLQQHPWHGDLAVYADVNYAELLCFLDPSLRERIVVVLAEESAEENAVHSENGSGFRMIVRHRLLDQPIDCGVLITDRQLTTLDSSLLSASIKDSTIAFDLTVHQQQSNSDLISVRWFCREDMQCSKLCVTFEFLTGIKPDPQAVQELLDEFSSW